MSKWFWLKATGEIEEKPWAHIPDLAELQAAVGGYVERVQLDGCTYLWANENGLFEKLPINPLATEVCQWYHGKGMAIVGDVLLEVYRPTKKNKVVSQLVEEYRKEAKLDVPEREDHPSHPAPDTL